MLPGQRIEELSHIFRAQIQMYEAIINILVCLLIVC